ncbi:excalibur calcium-binding domain-containing protein [Thermoflavimicrobium daqui]|uniref:LPXTG-motif cell wall anchor domain protein n=1 Tax=Thermoflavimicrobium daqui TaxID=2137476 RepID=A0A364K8V0_9BACL|nr:excalibur calcium-binding domain-containing protein [Thermoflavimicrobium daqui]RAL26721.1 hypothetical protein DL897_01325 [Thermoflavimicrobium daqui]
MKRLFILFFSFTVSILAFSNTASAADNGMDGIDKNCSDFPSQDQAQTYFIQDGGSKTRNVDDLDRDNDGNACEDEDKDPNNSGNHANNDDNNLNSNDSISTHDNQNNNTPSNQAGNTDPNQTGERLPNTATHYPNAILIGILLLIVGVILIMLQKKKQNQG